MSRLVMRQFDEHNNETAAALQQTVRLVETHVTVVNPAFSIIRNRFVRGGSQIDFLSCPQDEDSSSSDRLYSTLRQDARWDHPRMTRVTGHQPD